MRRCTRIVCIRLNVQYNEHIVSTPREPLSDTGDGNRPDTSPAKEKGAVVNCVDL